MIKDEIKNLIKINMDINFKDYDENIREKLTKASLDSLEKNLKELKKAIKEKNKDQILFNIHSIKGIFLNTHCFNLAEKFDDSKLSALSLDQILLKTNFLLKEII